MKIILELEIESIEDHTESSGNLQRLVPSGYRKCNRCGGLKFYHPANQHPMVGSKGDDKAPYYCAEESPATAPFVVCVNCHKILFMQ